MKKSELNDPKLQKSASVLIINGTEVKEGQARFFRFLVLLNPL